MLRTVTIHHIRPGKKEQAFTEGFVSEDEHGLSTRTILTDEETVSLSERLFSQGLIEPDDRVHFVAKFYSFSEPFNLLIFGNREGEALGYYSDVAMPLRKVDGGYELLDLFLDIWLKPDGTLLELDMDEFQEAVSRGLITRDQQTLALSAFERLKEEVIQGIYPQRYIQAR